MPAASLVDRGWAIAEMTTSVAGGADDDQAVVDAGHFFRSTATNRYVNSAASYDTSADFSFTYDHRLKKTGHPVRSAIHKLQIGRLVVGWVTTSESLLLYVFCILYVVVSTGHW